MNMTILKNLILSNNFKKLFPVLIFIFGLLAGGAVIYFQKSFLDSDNFLTQQQAGEKAIEFINQAVQEDVTASLISAAETSGVYKIHLQIADQEYDSYMTKDGKLLFSSAFDTEIKAEENQ